MSHIPSLVNIKGCVMILLGQAVLQNKTKNSLTPEEGDISACCHITLHWEAAM